jgi:hypothetical protein
MLKKLMGLTLLAVVALGLTLPSLSAMANHRIGHKQPCACCKVCKCEPVCNCPKA